MLLYKAWCKLDCEQYLFLSDSDERERKSSASGSASLPRFLPLFSSTLSRLPSERKRDCSQSRCKHNCTFKQLFQTFLEFATCRLCKQNVPNAKWLHNQSEHVLYDQTFINMYHHNNNYYNNIIHVLTKRKAHTGRISALGLDSTDWDSAARFKQKRQRVDVLPVQSQASLV